MGPPPGLAVGTDDAGPEVMFLARERGYERDKRPRMERSGFIQYFRERKNKTFIFPFLWAPAPHRPHPCAAPICPGFCATSKQSCRLRVDPYQW